MKRINKAIGHIKLKDLQPLHLNAFYRNLAEDGVNMKAKRDEKGNIIANGRLSPKTIVEHHRVISKLLSTAVKWNYINDNVAKRADPPKVPARDIEFLDENETKEMLKALNGESITYRTMILLLVYTGMRRGDDDDKIRLNQRKPSKYKGLRRFGPEKNLQRINKFMKERPIFYKNLIQMKENIRFYLRCFYCITKVMILQFNSENRTELARNG